MAYFLTSERLGFRWWTERDLAVAMELWGSPAVTAMIGGPFSEASVRVRLAKEIADGLEVGVQYWPIFLLEGGGHVGCAGLRRRSAEPKVCEFGVHLRREFWRRGLAEEAGRAVVGYAFEALGVEALFAGHHPGNEASRRLLAKLGFEPTHEEFYPPTGRMHPSYWLRRPG